MRASDIRYEFDGPIRELGQRPKHGLRCPHRRCYLLRAQVTLRISAKDMPAFFLYPSVKWQLDLGPETVKVLNTRYGGQLTSSNIGIQYD